VTVKSATISLPFLSHRRDTFLDGLPTTRLDSYLSSAPFPVAADVIEGATAQFDLPGPLTRQPKSAPGRGGRLTARVRRRGRRLTVSGTAPAGARVTITVVRKKRRLARRTVVLGGSVRRYSARLKVRRKRGLRVRVAARTRAGKTLRVSRRA
jgi:hypothetical protein